MACFLAALFIALLLPASADAAIYEAESFSHDSSAVVTNPVTASGGHALAFIENGTASLQIDSPTGSAIKVRARGGINCAGWPHMVASVDGTVIVDGLVTQAVWSATYVPYSLSAGAHTLSVSFDNAYEDATCKRILRVDFVRVYEAKPAIYPVRGMYDRDDSATGFDTLASLGFNYIDSNPSPSSVDPLAARGLKGFVYLGNYSNTTCQFANDDAWVRSHVASVAGHAGVGAYYVADEPDAATCPNAPAQIKARSDLVHSLDPGPPTLMVDYKVSQFALWKGKTDILGLDHYPCNFADGCRYNLIDEQAAEADRLGIRYWGIVQAHGDGTYYRPPTPAEMHEMFNHWRATNMEGYLVFSWRWSQNGSLALKDNPQLQDQLAVENGASPSAPTAFRPYAETSVWNTTIAQKGGVLQGSNPASGEFGTTFFGALGGGDLAYSKPIYFASGGEQCRTARLRNPDWNTGDTQIPASDCIPVPAGLAAATGSDGHLIVISADRTTAWAFWRCKQGSDSGSPCTESNVLANRYDAANGSKWNLSGDGVADCCGDSTGRGSGTELVTNVLKQDEAALGVRHVMGLTTPGTVHSGAIYPPALKSDGSNSSSRLKYGMLFALRPDYPCPSAVGPANVCAALKAYGVYLVDQASSSGSEVDTTGVNSQSPASGWSSVGISRNALPLTGSDWRCVDLPGVSGECP